MDMKTAPTISAIYGFDRKIDLKRPLFACGVSAGFPSPADDYIPAQEVHHQLPIIWPACHRPCLAQGGAFLLYRHCRRKAAGREDEDRLRPGLPHHQPISGRGTAVCQLQDRYPTNPHLLNAGTDPLCRRCAAATLPPRLCLPEGRCGTLGSGFSQPRAGPSFLCPTKGAGIAHERRRQDQPKVGQRYSAQRRSRSPKTLEK